MNIILASASPRRKQLMELLQLPFTVQNSNVDEQYDESLTPKEVVLYLSKIKAQAIALNYPNDLIIGSDTLVVCKNQILGKPKNEEEIYQMLEYLSNRTHQVLTGVTLIQNNQTESFVSETDVSFYEITNSEIKDYIDTKEPFDKAGAYGIQGYAAKFVKEIKGDYYTVMGLPIGELYQRLKKHIG